MGMRISVALLLLAGLAMPAAAQGKGPKKYAVTTDQALVVTKDVLVKQGYEVVRVENRGRDYVVWYRRGNKGRALALAPPIVAAAVPDHIIATPVLHPHHLEIGRAHV